MINVIKVDMGIYEHWAIESDRFYNGKPMLISNTKRNGTSQEEPWDTVVKGRPYKVTTVESSEPRHTIISRARSTIGQVRYNLTNYNCEHFVREMITGIAESKQVKKAIVISAALSLVYLFLRNK